MQSAEGVQPAVAEQVQPLGKLAHAAAQQVGDLEPGLAIGDPEQGRETLVDALVVGRVAAALEFLALPRVEVCRLHRAPCWADLGPVETGD
jgi:hypothetical protein